MIMRTTITRTAALFGAVISLACTANAQSHVSVFELRPFVGAFVPTGDNREIFTDALLTGLSGAYRLSDRLSLVGTLGWAASKVRGELPVGFSKNNLDIYVYDVGLQLTTPRTSSESWSFTPIVGVGAGGRTYNLREDHTDARTDPSFYGALGAEVSRGRLGVRVTTRDYVTAMKRYADGESGRMARNDLAFGAGLTVRF